LYNHRVHVKSRPEEFQNYLIDASNIQGGTADRLVIPEAEADVIEILREANASGTRVTVSGGRTGTVGGAIPFGGIVVSLERLNKIKQIDRNRLCAVVEPGVVLADLQRAVEAEGLFYPPDPTEWSCQVGGTVATNASGSRSFKYGATRNFVRRIKVVLGDGDVLELARGETRADETGIVRLRTSGGREIKAKLPTYRRPNVRKNVSGYFAEPEMDAIDLFIGSEGTLGIVTEIELTLLPKSEGFFSGIVFFENESNLLAFVDAARAASFENRRSKIADSLDASLLEYFDARSLTFIAEKFPETPSGMAGAVFFEQETSSATEDTLLEQWNALLEKHDAEVDLSWFSTTEQDRERMRAFRHALPVSVNERIVKYGQRKVGTDMAVPDRHFPSFLWFYQQTLDTSGLEYVIFGHIGDCHLHANMLPRNEAEAEKAGQIYGRCIAQAIMLGGVVSAEHGIGKLKRKYLAAMMGERYLNEMAEIKRALDPKCILNRGNIFDESYLGFAAH
jgi:D-lactate dehydrogenase (cytochrome)